MTTPQVDVLSRVKHKHLMFTPLNDYSFASTQNTVPILPFEVVEAANSFPIFFPDTRSASPHALLGLGKTNVFVDNHGRWQATYLPLLIANYPFSIIEARFTDENVEKRRNPEFAVGIDVNAPHFHQKKGLALFEDDGSPTETLTHIKNALLTQYKNQEVLSHALAELRQYDVLRERAVTVRYKGEVKSVAGLRCVDREKFFSLPESILGHFAKNGVLEILYAHWQSMRHLPLLLSDPSCPPSVKNNQKNENKS